MLIDSFLFLNEYDMLECRLEYLNDVVDYFVIVECDHTHSGMYKGFNFVKEHSRYRKYQDKILYIPFSIDPSKYHFTKPKTTDYNSGQWFLERDNRDYISKALKLFKPDDIVMISDVDEVCTKQSIIETMNKLNPNCGAYGSNQEMFWYNFKQKEAKIWSGSVIAYVGAVLNNTPEWFRKNRWNLPKSLVGYHMTYFMPIEKMKYKIESFSHQEWNYDEYKSESVLQKKVEDGVMAFDSKNNPLVAVTPEQIDKEIYSIFSRCLK